MTEVIPQVNRLPIGVLRGVLLGSPIRMAETGNPVIVPPPNYIVPNIPGDSLAAGETALTNAGFFNFDVINAYSQTVPIGDIISTDPAFGSGVLPSDTVITITVSLGPFPTQNAYGRFVGSPVFKAIEVANIGDIEPKVWDPPRNGVTRS